MQPRQFLVIHDSYAYRLLRAHASPHSILFLLKRLDFLLLCGVISNGDLIKAVMINRLRSAILHPGAY